MQSTLTSNIISAPMLGYASAPKVSYPLYDVLVSAVQSAPVTVNATNMAYTINLMADNPIVDKQGINCTLQHYHEILYICIHHAVLHQNYQPNPKQLPYGIRVMSSGRGALVVVGDLPGTLVQLLTAYLDGKY